LRRIVQSQPNHLSWNTSDAAAAAQSHILESRVNVVLGHISHSRTELSARK
jgi:hypothetical protein